MARTKQPLDGQNTPGRGPACPAGEEPVTVCAPNGLNLRVGPSPHFPVREVLPDGAELTAVGLPEGAQVPEWSLVRWGKRLGWAESSYLKAKEKN